MPYLDYIEIVKRQLIEVKNTQQSNIEKASIEIADRLINNHKLYLVASGVHSNMICEEAFYRAGNLMLVHPIFHKPATGPRKGLKGNVFENSSGYAKALLDSTQLGEGDVIIVISNSGVSEFPVEICLESKRKCAFVISLSSISYSSSINPRHTSMKRIHEIADIALDNCAVPGDAVLRIEGFPGKIAPTSTITGSAIINNLMILIIQEFVKRKIDPPVFMSTNFPGAAEWNAELLEKYKSNIGYL